MFKWNRFDLPIKFLFLKFYDKDINSSFADDMYKEHLRLWNGFKEYDNPNKNSYDRFRDDFTTHLDELKAPDEVKVFMQEINEFMLTLKEEE